MRNPKQAPTQQTSTKSFRHPKPPLEEAALILVTAKKPLLAPNEAVTPEKQTLADGSFKAAACWVAGAVVCASVPLPELFIYILVLKQTGAVHFRSGSHRHCLFLLLQPQ